MADDDDPLADELSQPWAPTLHRACSAARRRPPTISVRPASPAPSMEGSADSAFFSSFSAADPAIHHSLKVRDDLHGCLLCNQPSHLNAAHAVAAANAQSVVQFHQKRVLPFADHRSLENRLLLCVNCHACYDCDKSPPTFILLPRNLDVFLEAENNPSNINGSVPTVDSYFGAANAEYQVYPLVNPSHFPCLERTMEVDGGVRRCFVCPTAVIVKASTALFFPAEQGWGLPPAVREKMTRIMALYVDRRDEWDQPRSPAKDAHNGGGNRSDRRGTRKGRGRITKQGRPSSGTSPGKAGHRASGHEQNNYRRHTVGTRAVVVSTADTLPPPTSRPAAFHRKRSRPDDLAVSWHLPSPPYSTHEHASPKKRRKTDDVRTEHRCNSMSDINTNNADEDRIFNGNWTTEDVVDAVMVGPRLRAEKAAATSSMPQAEIEVEDDGSELVTEVELAASRRKVMQWKKDAEAADIPT